MLEIARMRVPGVPLTIGPMTDFRLGKTFDAVTCLFSSVGYLLSAELLNRAISNMGDHLMPGGILIVEPWITPDQWKPRQPEAVFVDESTIKIARMSRVSRRGELATMVFHYLVGTKEGVEYFTEEHKSRLHSHPEYLSSLAAARLDPEFEAQGLMGRGLYIGHRKAD